MARQIICKTCKSPATKDGNKITCTGCGLETEGLSFAWIAREIEEPEPTKQEEPKMEEKKAEQKRDAMPNKKTKLCEVEGLGKPEPAEKPGFPTYQEAMAKVRVVSSFIQAEAHNVVILDFTEHKDLLKTLKEHSKEEFRTPEEQALWCIKEVLVVLEV
ncbi:MAG: hypothetical protein A4E62_02427 [Syntrophorhabdus sp. PtaU1.Bin002]|nr:MAG: hypothetical protein A4E62_02427 [Syntrophorhabdus sp. PtaU1.Bin002]